MDGWNFCVDVFSIADNLVVLAFPLFLCLRVAKHIEMLAQAHTYTRQFAPVQKILLDEIIV